MGMEDGKIGQRVVSLTKYQIFETITLALASFTQGTYIHTYIYIYFT